MPSSGQSWTTVSAWTTTRFGPWSLDWPEPIPPAAPSSSGPRSSPPQGLDSRRSRRGSSPTAGNPRPRWRHGPTRPARIPSSCQRRVRTTCTFPLRASRRRSRLIPRRTRASHWATGSSPSPPPVCARIAAVSAGTTGAKDLRGSRTRSSPPSVPQVVSGIGRFMGRHRYGTGYMSCKKPRCVPRPIRSPAARRGARAACTLPAPAAHRADPRTPPNRAHLLERGPRRTRDYGANVTRSDVSRHRLCLLGAHPAGLRTREPDDKGAPPCSAL